MKIKLNRDSIRILIVTIALSIYGLIQIFSSEGTILQWAALLVPIILGSLIFSSKFSKLATWRVSDYWSLLQIFMALYLSLALIPHFESGIFSVTRSLSTSYLFISKIVSPDDYLPAIIAFTGSAMFTIIITTKHLPKKKFISAPLILFVTSSTLALSWSKLALLAFVISTLLSVGISIARVRSLDPALKQIKCWILLVLVPILIVSAFGKSPSVNRLYEFTQYLVSTQTQNTPSVVVKGPESDAENSLSSRIDSWSGIIASTAPIDHIKTISWGQFIRCGNCTPGKYLGFADHRAHNGFLDLWAISGKSYLISIIIVAGLLMILTREFAMPFIILSMGLHTITQPQFLIPVLGVTFVARIILTCSVYESQD